MKIMTSVLLGLVIGYIVGIMLGSIAAFVFGLDNAARFIAVGCAFLGVLLGILAANSRRNQAY